MSVVDLGVLYGCISGDFIVLLIIKAHKIPKIIVISSLILL